jgi:competence protein ComEA
MRLDLNTATAAELSMLPGIGPRLAERIVSDRAANGPFRSHADLARVRGIGPVVVERIEPFVVASAASDATGGPTAEP